MPFKPLHTFKLLTTVVMSPHLHLVQMFSLRKRWKGKILDPTFYATSLNSLHTWCRIPPRRGLCPHAGRCHLQYLVFHLHPLPRHGIIVVVLVGFLEKRGREFHAVHTAQSRQQLSQHALIGQHSSQVPSFILQLVHSLVEIAVFLFENTIFCCQRTNSLLQATDVFFLL